MEKNGKKSRSSTVEWWYPAKVSLADSWLTEAARLRFYAMRARNWNTKRRKNFLTFYELMNWTFSNQITIRIWTLRCTRIYGYINKYDFFKKILYFNKYFQNEHIVHYDFKMRILNIMWKQIIIELQIAITSEI